MKLDIKERLTLLARGDNLDLADIVCADAVARIEALEAALREIVIACYSDYISHNINKIARAALAPEQEK